MCTPNVWGTQNDLNVLLFPDGGLQDQALFPEMVYILGGGGGVWGGRGCVTFYFLRKVAFMQAFLT
jgi:hypothetical protein